MLFKPLLGTQLSGSTGGVTASRNRFGTYFRQRANPVNPATPLQLAVRSAMQQLVDAWQITLTSAQRTGWDTYAANVPVLNRIGDVIHLTGQNHYIRSNIPRVANSLTRIDDAPVDFTLGGPGLPLAASISEATQNISLIFDDSAPWVDLDDAHLLLYQSRPQATSVNFFKGPYRLAGTVDGDSVTAPTSPATIASAFPVVEDAKVFYMVRLADADGRLSAEYRFPGFVVA